MNAFPVLVTGGAGFMGRHLVRQLVATGHAVRVLDPDLTTAQFGPGVQAVSGSVVDRSTLARLMKGVRQVFHLAGQTHRPSDR